MIEVSSTPAVAEFHAALARAFAAVEHAKQEGKDTNKKASGQRHRPYSTLTDVDRACREALTTEGFSFPQFPVTRWTEDGRMFISVRTLLCRQGVTLSEPEPFELPVLGQRLSNASGGGHGPPDAQAVGSALTYARRYSLSAAIGICPEDDDGHAASSPTAAKSDPKWDAFEALVRQLAAMRKHSFKDAYQDIKNEADTFPGEGGPDDQQLMRLVDAADRLLKPKPAKPTPMDRLNGAVDRLAKKMAMDASAAGKLIEKAAGVELDGHPTPAQVVTLMGVAERMLAESEQPNDPQNTPGRDGWVKACRDLLNLMKADYTSAEGESPDEEALKSIRAHVTVTSGIDHRKANEPEFFKSTERVEAEIARRKAP